MTFEEVAMALREHPAVDEGPGASEAEIAQAERELGLSFPTNYRLYLQTFGWLEIGSHEMFGLGRDVPEYLHLVSMTLEERTIMHPLTPHNLIPVINDGGGNLVCLDTSRSMGDDCPVVFQDHALDEIRDFAESFLDWLVKEMAAQAPQEGES